MRARLAGRPGPRRLRHVRWVAAAVAAVAIAAGPVLAVSPRATPGAAPEPAAPRRPAPRTAAAPAAPAAISLDTPGTNERVSVADDESQLNGTDSDQAAVTPDGRFVVFRAGIAGAGPADRNDAILLRDRAAGTTTQIFPPAQQSSQIAPVRPPVLAEEPTISADGNLVAFTLTAGRAGVPHVVLWQRDSGLSLPLAAGDLSAALVAGSTFGRIGSLHPRLSADGSVLVFLAQPQGDSSSPPFAGYYALVFATRVVEAVSARTGETAAVGGPAEFGTAAVSADGNLVAFSSSLDFEYMPIIADYVPVVGALNSDFSFYPAPTGLWANPEGGTYDGTSDGQVVYVPRPKQIWLRNRLARTTTLVSVAAGVPGAVGGSPGGGDSDHPAMSADGGAIAFDSAAPDLVAGDGNGTTDVFVRAGFALIRRVSVPPGGGEADDASTWPAVSADGRLIAFASRATNLVPGDTNHLASDQADRPRPYDIFLNGPPEDRLSRVSVGVGTKEPDDSSQRPSLASNGDLVVFDSLATNLVEGDTNGTSDVFARVRTKPVPEPQRIPAIAANPNPVDFGVIVLGDLRNALRTVAVSSIGTAPLAIASVSISGPDAADFLPVSDTCTGRILPPGAGCSIGLLFAVDTPRARAATLLVGNSSARDPYPIPLRAERAADPRLTLRPPSGPPGTVVIAHGTGFPRNYPVSFTWSEGITPIPLTVTQTDAAGEFNAQVLVIPNDVVGPRRLGAAVDLGGFVAPTAPFLVTRPTAIPPKFETSQELRDPQERVIVLRR